MSYRVSSLHYRQLHTSVFLTSYLNIAIFAGMQLLVLKWPPKEHSNSKAVLYIFFKFYLKSKVVPLDQIDIRSDIEEIKEEKAQGVYLTEKQLDWPWWIRLLHWI